MRNFILAVVLLLAPAIGLAEQTLYIKYRSTPVDVDKPYFEYLDTSKSSLVTGAWYDQSKKYMIIGLNGTNYHYCGMPESAWKSFKGADSFGSHYRYSIKGNYDCRINPVPNYG